MLHKGFSCTFHLVRHGETAVNENDAVIAGRNSETSLNSRGREQAQALGKRFQKEGVQFDAIYSSPLERALQTTQAMCDVIGYDQSKIVVSEALVEFTQGGLEGRLRKEIYTPEFLNYMNTKGSLFVPPSGESQRMVERRVSNWLEDEVLYNTRYTSSPDKLQIAVVTHGMVLKTLLHYIMGFDDRLIWRIDLANCSVSRVTFRREGWFIGSINDCWHLRETGTLDSLQRYLV